MGGQCARLTVCGYLSSNRLGNEIRSGGDEFPFLMKLNTRGKTPSSAPLLENIYKRIVRRIASSCSAQFHGIGESSRGMHLLYLLPSLACLAYPAPSLAPVRKPPGIEFERRLTSKKEDI